MNGLRIKLGAFELELSQETVGELSVFGFSIVIVAAIVAVWILA